MEGVGRCGGNAERGGGRCAGVRGSVVKVEGERVDAVWGVWQGVGMSGGGRGDVRGVWNGLGEVRSVGKDVSICEERCGCVEKCCVGGVGKRGKTKIGLHGHRSSFFRTKSREDQKMVLHFS